jgi:photosystem II stability/assembly factor-like uncharacterized protein
MKRCARLVLAGLLVATGCRAPDTAPTPDAGPWQSVAVPTAASLRALAVADTDVLWVGGADGTLLRTADGGATWRDVAPPGCAACDFRDVHAFGADEALVMVAGQPARLYRTDDAGRRWTIVHEDPRPAAFFDAIAFDGDEGVLFGDPVGGAFAVCFSRDAGRTWRPAAAAQVPAPVPGEAGFAASGTCAVVVRGPGAVPRALVATGGGAARCLQMSFGAHAPRVVPLPLAQGAASRGAFSLAVRGGCQVVVGGDYEAPRNAIGSAAWSDDGGGTWHPCEAGAGGYRSAVVWLDDERLLAVGSHGASLSVDRGRSWRPFGATGFHALAVGRDGRVWACGSDGRVARLRRFGKDLARAPG